MIRFCLFGSGRMGDLYCEIIARNPDAELVGVINPNLPSARKLTDRYGGRAFASFDDCLKHSDVDAAIVCSPTNTHLEIIRQVAEAGKAILCEKPIDLSLERVDECIALVEQHRVPFMVGFNRRFDPTVAALRAQVADGKVGDLNMVLLTSRDPAPPPIGYIERSGGYFCDSTIHDIDLACWITGETPVEVFASGSCLVDEDIGKAGDIDTAMTTLKMPSGVLCHINNSRKAVYGFDQRIEVFGSGGMLQTLNQRDILLSHSSSEATDAKPLLKHFFLERYAASFEQEIAEFISCLASDTPTSVDQNDGKRALEIALACEQSLKEGRAIRF
ncbi:inositol 2-dehydrogenase [Marinobacterium nitratireducens]|uniref:Inositol 2-dehydrogenase n=1 Tax=Marinobacterium nitratireducens TaxID=518897 RepID=A0A918DXC6_9GAMM|nr:inositol 2-dehydrogenase [Marinobacterium nitratireducens]GGO86362.1 inositol 2-dehydrogenase [Marinobacterium nitratireducens]